MWLEILARYDYKAAGTTNNGLGSVQPGKTDTFQNELGFVFCDKKQKDQLLQGQSACDA
jgi:hypothetical protein